MTQLPHYSKFALFFVLVLLFISCQEESVTEDIALADKDMEAAIQLADEYLKASNAREANKSITVLKYKDGKLLYGTNTDTEISYKEITEETITATVKEGEYIFWFSGGGLTDLDGIEFDEASQDELSDLPEEVQSDKMWVITIPEKEDTGEDVTYLKYDILYQHEDYNGAPIRLDPKIQVTH